MHKIRKVHHGSVPWRAKVVGTALSSATPGFISRTLTLRKLRWRFLPRTQERERERERDGVAFQG